MEEGSISARLAHSIALGGRNLLARGLPLAVLVAGVGAVATTGAPAIAGQPSALAGRSGTVAVATVQQDTVIGTYTGDRADITVTRRVIGTGADAIVGYVADVTVDDATTLESAFAGGSFSSGTNETVSAMARRNDAVLAINADFARFRDDGIIIRNGEAYRDAGVRHGLGILRDGGFLLYDETATSAAELLAEGVWQGLSFGPHLVRDGAVVSGIETYEIGDFGPVQPGAAGSIQGRQPRTGIGLLSPNHFVMIVVDGRGAGGSRGVTMPEFADMFLDAGATTAFNLDGGGSATMYFDGEVVNSPAFVAERATSEALFIAR